MNIFHMDDNIIFGTIVYMSFGFVFVMLPMTLLFKVFGIFQVEEVVEEEEEVYPYLDNLDSRVSILESEIEELENENAELRVTQRLWESLPENRKEFI